MEPEIFLRNSTVGILGLLVGCRSRHRRSIAHSAVPFAFITGEENISLRVAQASLQKVAYPKRYERMPISAISPEFTSARNLESESNAIREAP